MEFTLLLKRGVTMNKNLLSGLASTLLGLIYTIQAYQLPKASIGNEWAPIYFPLGLGVLMLLFGFILIILGLREVKSERGGAEKGKRKLEFTYTAKLITYVSILSILYALLFDRIGYLLSTIFFMGAILMVVNGLNKWKVNVLISVGFSLAIYILFSKLLGIILPPMPFIEF